MTNSINAHSMRKNSDLATLKKITWRKNQHSGQGKVKISIRSESGRSWMKVDGSEAKMVQKRKWTVLGSRFLLGNFEEI